MSSAELKIASLEYKIPHVRFFVKLHSKHFQNYYILLYFWQNNKQRKLNSCSFCIFRIPYLANNIVWLES